MSGQAIQKDSSRKGVGGGGKVGGTRSSMMTDILHSKMLNMALDINGKLMIARDTDDVHTEHTGRAEHTEHTGHTGHIEHTGHTEHTEPHTEWQLIHVLISTFGNWLRCCLHSRRGCCLIGDTKRKLMSSRM